MPVIHEHGAGFRDASNEQLRKESLSLRYRAKSGEPMGQLLPEAYALVREAARRTLDMEHFDVQLVGGIALFHGSIAEMETGEGKTLTATLPIYLRALPGKGVHLATVNDYLAARDAQWMQPVFDLLGMTLGIIQSQMPNDDRRVAYAKDITYGTAKEFGFDFLRDRLLLREQGLLLDQNQGVGIVAAPTISGEQPVQRSAYFALVDEADSILIDEARTPLIISALPGEAEKIACATYEWCALQTEHFEEDDHYDYDHEKKTVELSADGRQLVRALEKPEILDSVGLIDLYEHIERSIKIEREFHRDRHYVVRDDEIVIVDESTGRLAEGRKWRAGIHQAIEARDGVDVTVDAGQAARITVQDFFLRYRYLAGMTGTASTSASELKKIYRLNVLSIPTNKPARRAILSEKVFGDAESKWDAIVDEVQTVHETGRPVLIGTRSIDRSLLLSQRLTQAGIEHSILNAHNVAKEAEIVAQAGQPGRVTVSTNMAGRGTDIKLGPGVAEMGGLHVICTELHDSARIDRQLIGRCGRQGDPGSVQQYLAMDDDVFLFGYGPKKAARIHAEGRRANGQLQRMGRRFRRAQQRIENRNFRGRKILLYHEKQRRKVQREIGQDPYLDSPD